MAGKFIVLEGLDASGKSTQIDLLLSRVRRNHGRAIRVKSPNPTSETGKLIYSHLKGEWFTHPAAKGGVHEQDPLVFQALQTVNRYEDAPRLRKLLEGGTHVLHDRYFPSGEAYGRVDGLDPTWLRTVHLSLPQPDLVIYLDIGIEESMRRRPARRDRYEGDTEFLSLVQRAYTDLFLERAQEGLPYVIIDGEGAVQEVHEHIWSTVNLLFSRAITGGPIL